MGVGSRFSSARYSATTNAVPLTSPISDMSPSRGNRFSSRWVHGVVLFHLAWSRPPIRSARHPGAAVVVRRQRDRRRGGVRQDRRQIAYGVQAPLVGAPRWRRGRMLTGGESHRRTPNRHPQKSSTVPSQSRVEVEAELVSRVHRGQHDSAGRAARDVERAGVNGCRGQGQRSRDV